MSTFSEINDYYGDECETEHFYKNGESVYYSYKGVFYTAEYPEHLAKLEYDFREAVYEIEHSVVEESVQLDELLEAECSELRRQLYEKHGYEKGECDAIEGLMRFIKSFTNPEEMRKKINTALLIPESKMYNQNWAGTEWDWFTGQLNKDEIAQWTFTDEERESIRISQETIRNMVESSKAEDNV